MLTAFLYGAGLGIGFFTFLATGTLVVVGLAAFVSGSAAAGAVVVGAFGLARGLSAVTAARVRTVEDGAALVDRLAARSERRRAIVAAGSLVLVAIASLGATSSGGSGAARLAGAALAVTFLWAAAAKLAVPARWRRALVMHELPGWVQRRAVLGVPAAEAIVPALALAGYPRAAAWWAASLLVVFACGGRAPPGRDRAAASRADASGAAPSTRRGSSCCASRVSGRWRRSRSEVRPADPS